MGGETYTNINLRMAIFVFIILFLIVIAHFIGNMAHNTQTINENDYNKQYSDLPVENKPKANFSNTSQIKSADNIIGFIGFLFTMVTFADIPMPFNMIMATVQTILILILVYIIAKEVKSFIPFE